MQNWLASCTIIPERTNNHAWFTALNQAARLELSRTFQEFKGDEEWMLADLKAMDALAPVGEDGWYSDHPQQPVFDSTTSGRSATSPCSGAASSATATRSGTRSSRAA